MSTRDEIEAFNADLDTATREIMALTEGEDLTPAQMLEENVILALKRAKTLLSRDEPANGNLIRAQVALIQTFVSSAIKVQENLLRQKKVNALQRLTRLVEEERERQRLLGY